VIEKPVVKQIQSTLVNMMIILVGCPLAGVGLSFLNGELTKWSDIPRALDHGFFIAVCMTFAWLGMASPLASRLKTLINSIHSEDAQGVGTTSVSVSHEAVPGIKTTTTIEPKSDKVIVKEEPELEA
jgi:hypothetical protein